MVEVVDATENMKLPYYKKIKHYGKYLPKAGITSLILNKGAATHFVVYESQFVAASTFTSVVKWTAATVAGLGAYDSVSGATQITQIAPSSGSSTVPAKAGELLNLVYQITGAPHRARSWAVIGELPEGLNHLNSTNSNTDGITGIPSEPGTYNIKVRAYKGSNNSGYNYTKTFTIEVAPGSSPPSITNQPQSIKISSVDKVNLKVSASGNNLQYQWFNGESGDTSIPVPSATNSSLEVGPLSSDAKYWVKITNASGSVNSNTSKLKIIDNYNSWAEKQFASNPELMARDNDSDEDGLTNELEYVIGSSPKKHSIDPETNISLENSNLIFSFKAKKTDGDGYSGLERIYSVQESNDATQDSWTTLSSYSEITANDQDVTILRPLSSYKKYYRLKVQLREKS